jgi:DNA-binding transcriptional ArsR family regulator
MAFSEDPQLDGIMRALADPTRRRIFILLGRRPGLTTSQMTSLIPGMTRWGVMKHLNVLRDAGLLQTFPEGRRRRHYREATSLAALRDWLAGA